MTCSAVETFLFNVVGSARLVRMLDRKRQVESFMSDRRRQSAALIRVKSTITDVDVMKKGNLPRYAAVFEIGFVNECCILKSLCDFGSVRPRTVSSTASCFEFCDCCLDCSVHLGRLITREPFELVKASGVPQINGTVSDVNIHIH